MTALSICVYCGSRPGESSLHADAALAAGASVVGVIPQSLMARELGHTGLTELHVVETMHQRKMMMAERSDAFLALSGGIGTFEELFEVWSWRQLGYHDKPLGLLNVAGYYDALLAFLRQSHEQGFLSQLQLDLLQVESEPSVMLQLLGEMSPLATAPDDYTRI